MAEEKPYLRNDLTLSDLALALGCSSHQLSTLINQQLGEGFYEHINRYRLEQAKHLLAHGAPSRSILDIAYEAGFNGKNTFYRYFKAHESMTPSQYRQSHRDQ